MTTNEEDYSNFIQVLSNFIRVLSVFAGFTFTILTLLLTLLPDPSIIMAQVTLFFLAVLFDLCVFLVSWNTVNIVYFCKKVPPLTRQLAINNLLSLLTYYLSGVAIILMFLLWNLIYLALASAVVWASLIITHFILVMKPFQEFPKTRARILGVVEEKERPRD